ncbi:hypothetical protein DFH27DRAFT_616102 [Peziza echinospora]|nr:hypothetical protein DFH27DRAFT_616102 [Peziza echinospora]
MPFYGPDLPPLPVPERDFIPPDFIAREPPPTIPLGRDLIEEIRVQRSMLDDNCAYTYFADDLTPIVKPHFLKFKSAMTDPRNAQLQFWYMVCAPVVWELFFRSGKLPLCDDTDFLRDFAYPAWGVELPLFEHRPIDRGWSRQVLKTLIYTDDSEFEIMARQMYMVIRVFGDASHSTSAPIQNEDTQETKSTIAITKEQSNHQSSSKTKAPITMTSSLPPASFSPVLEISNMLGIFHRMETVSSKAEYLSATILPYARIALETYIARKAIYAMAPQAELNQEIDLVMYNYALLQRVTNVAGLDTNNVWQLKDILMKIRKLLQGNDVLL